MLNYIKTNPTIVITGILAALLIILGIYSIIPASIIGAATFTTNAIRFIFGIFILIPALPVLYWIIRDKREEYEMKQSRTRPYLFWMGVTFFYLTVFRLLAYGLFPPVGVLYLGCGLITMVIWLGVKKKNG
jgi:hypothetical protein